MKRRTILVVNKIWEKAGENIMKHLARFVGVIATVAAFFGIGVASTSLFYQPQIPEELKK